MLAFIWAIALEADNQQKLAKAASPSVETASELCQIGRAFFQGIGRRSASAPIQPMANGAVGAEHARSIGRGCIFGLHVPQFTG